MSLTFLSIIGSINSLNGKFIRSGRDVILCYHAVDESGWEFSVTPAQFEQHIKILRDHFDIVSVPQMLETENLGHRPRLAITFDDGYKSIYDNALPVLRKYGVTALVFLNDNMGKAYLKKDQIKELVLAGWTMGFHTSSHQDVTKLYDPLLEVEIKRGKEKLEEKLGLRLTYFAYPFGRYNNKAVKMVERSGFLAAFTVDGGALVRDGQFTKNRVTISRYASAGALISLTSPLGLAYNSVSTRFLKFKDAVWEALS
jgi:peptidoglycan/xylan/chitin deacetylase (PgdA/CDA1 family)